MNFVKMNVTEYKKKTVNKKLEVLSFAIIPTWVVGEDHTCPVCLWNFQGENGIPGESEAMAVLTKDGVFVIHKHHLNDNHR